MSKNDYKIKLIYQIYYIWYISFIMLAKMHLKDDKKWLQIKVDISHL